MNNNWTEKDYWTGTALALLSKLFLIPIIIIGIMKSCLSSNVYPLDDSINKSREIVDHVLVVDSSYNGFRIVYATKDEITKERLKEIKSRPLLNQTISRIKKEAPLYFGGLLETDIYDFARFTLKYPIDDDVQMHNIFVYGADKSNFYIGNNPQIKNPAKYFHFATEQGIQYINHMDIYYRTNGNIKIYRYWKCYGINELSYTDERFSHFSEDERIW